MSSDHPGEKPATYEDLLQENSALRKDLELAQISREYFWNLFVEASRRLQVSSASIKAAVSSLLNYEIFWDPANQHEFLKTINLSVDKVGRLISLFNLAFRAEAGSLAIKPEPQSLQEILAVVQANAVTRFPKLQTKFILPKEGKPVMVDYEYLIIAFSFLFDLFGAGDKTDKIKVAAVENQKDWRLDIAGLDPGIVDLFQTMHSCRADVAAVAKYAHLPEHVLGLHVACQIFNLQAITMEIAANTAGDPILRLVVPAFVNSAVE